MRRIPAWVVWGIALAAVGAVLPPMLRAVVRLPFPAGLDPALWGFTALELEAGSPPLVPPVYALLVAGLHGSGDVVAAAALASWLAAAVAGPLIWATARALGAGPRLAGVAALLALSLPRVGGFAVSVSPDALTVDLFAASVLVAARWGERRSLPWLAGLLAVAGLAPMIREHGLLLSLGLGVVAVAGPGAWWQRIARAAGVAAAVVLAPLLANLGPTLPWDVPWTSRMQQPLTDLLVRSRPAFLGDVPDQFHADRMPVWARDLLLDLYRRHQRPGIVAFHAGWAVFQAPAHWLLVIAALAAALRLPRGRALPALAGLVPVLPGLAIWSAPRHVMVAVPVALATLAAWLALPRTRAGSRAAAAAGLVAAGLAASTWTTWGARAHELRSQADHVARLARFGRALCAEAAPGDVGMGVAEAFLYCPMPHHKPGKGYGAAEWHAWWVVLQEVIAAEGEGRTSQPLPTDPWSLATLRVEGVPFMAYRLAPGLWDRPCAASRPAPEYRLRILNPTTVPMTPPCRADPPGLVPP